LYTSSAEKQLQFCTVLYHCRYLNMTFCNIILLYIYYRNCTLSTVNTYNHSHARKENNVVIVISTENLTLDKILKTLSLIHNISYENDSVCIIGLLTQSSRITRLWQELAKAKFDKWILPRKRTSRLNRPTVSDQTSRTKQYYQWQNYNGLQTTVSP